MVTWEKVNPNGNRGRPVAGPRLWRGKTLCVLALPDGAPGGHKRADWFTDNGRLAIKFCADGGYAAAANSRSKYGVEISVPRFLWSVVPMGSTPITLRPEGDLLVIDMQPDAPDMAAE